MANVIQTRLIRIGNSQGIRIPAALIEQLQLTDVVELEIRDDYLIVRRGKRPRAGWAEAFRQMAEQGDDRLLMPDTNLTTWEETEWEW